MGESLSVSAGSLKMTVEPLTGGRVAQLWFGDRPLLSGPEVNPTNWGATFWTSPQADWGWPPVPEVDHLPYEVLESGESRVGLRSQLATIGASEFRIEKWIARARDSCIDVTYVVESTAERAFGMAAWEINRVGPGGLTFFPTGDTELTPIPPHGRLLLEKEGGVSFYDHADFSLGRSLKLHADGREGFLAHVVDGLLILKMFPDSPAERQAPLEGEVEIFANEDGRYVEIEVQGPYDEIAPGQRVSFTVRTHVRPVAPRLGRAELVELARACRRELSDGGEE